MRAGIAVERGRVGVAVARVGRDVGVGVDDRGVGADVLVGLKTVGGGVSVGTGVATTTITSGVGGGGGVSVAPSQPTKNKRGRIAGKIICLLMRQSIQLPAVFGNFALLSNSG